MANNITIRDVAERVGTSVATVSYALNRRPGMVSQEMGERIRRAAEELGYRPSRQARQLRGQSNMTLAMQLDSAVTLSNTWRSSFSLNLILLRGVSAYAVARGYHVHLLISEPGRDLEELEQQILNENAVDGVIFMGCRFDTPEKVMDVSARMASAGIGSVTVSENLGAMGMPLVAINLEPAVLAAVERLKALNCRRAGYVGLLHQTEHERVPRFELFKKALDDARIELPEWAALRTVREVDGYRHTIELLDRGALPDCIIYGSDHMAMAGMSALADRGVRVPEVVRVLGVDHAPYAAEAPVQLASLDQRFFDRGQTLAKVLLDQIAHPDHPVPSRTELDAEFVDGASLGRERPDRSVQSHLERSLETC
jgi:DNA-binding LacI/PurR family transcriptional regulator